MNTSPPINDNGRWFTGMVVCEEELINHYDLGKYSGFTPVDLNTRCLVGTWSIGGGSRRDYCPGNEMEVVTYDCK